ncbi:MAG: hypothetical protein JGK26_07745 [Microcoleus sp. PH2017_27_LUM_O_A]|uniref:hypothetical protein n=1 Tax=unclassified Microcoleus TaxID=2642155 RepID=UPI001D993149|nr:MULTISPECIES: hypothetical protein [unclassified Microcoleus]MCC3459668.1 hypothetical protein [Microcoleus sp. PH2017_11_PCY_U_A]TAE84110.1 MAG: hypothetical protein EAZ83_07740 [Oscillatoriales cyanobacterium]MCC3540048.1 hypothetical protein [Microcoleus sp. PH2017_22_RUC_O_B]MCC3559022.1 hypothetical protein [Microcoleus sp. PH2017_27_LUM_O_A]TAF21735.1 MAG: hypothetical protein EAZ73_08365 [Oscillatoriales cyanobacterium]
MARFGFGRAIGFCILDLGFYSPGRAGSEKPGFLGKYLSQSPRFSKNPVSLVYECDRIWGS